MTFFSSVQTVCCGVLASVPMSYSSISSALPFEYPPPNPRSNPKPPPAQTAHAWGERSRKEPVAAAAGPLSERCTQFRERILFLGPPICQEESEQEWRREAGESSGLVRSRTRLRPRKHSHEAWNLFVHAWMRLHACGISRSVLSTVEGLLLAAFLSAH